MALRGSDASDKLAKPCLHIHSNPINDDEFKTSMGAVKQLAKIFGYSERGRGNVRPDKRYHYSNSRELVLPTSSNEGGLLGKDGHVITFKCVFPRCSERLDPAVN